MACSTAAVGEGTQAVSAPAIGMGDLLGQHVGHAVGHRPHALADLGMADEAALEAGIDVGILVSRDPARLFHVALADHRPGQHGGMDLVSGAVEEAGVDEEDAPAGGADALFQVDRGAPFLVHDAHLERFVGQAEGLLDGGEHLGHMRHLARPVQLGHHDVDGAGMGIGATPVRSHVMQGDGGVDERIQQHLGRRLAAVIGDGIAGHQQPDIAHQHQAAPVQVDELAVRTVI